MNYSISVLGPPIDLRWGVHLKHQNLIEWCWKSSKESEPLWRGTWCPITHVPTDHYRHARQVFWWLLGYLPCSMNDAQLRTGVRVHEGQGLLTITLDAHLSVRGLSLHFLHVSWSLAIANQSPNSSSSSDHLLRGWPRVRRPCICTAGCHSKSTLAHRRSAIRATWPAQRSFRTRCWHSQVLIPHLSRSSPTSVVTRRIQSTQLSIPSSSALVLSDDVESEEELKCSGLRRLCKITRSIWRCAIFNLCSSSIFIVQALQPYNTVGVIFWSNSSNRFLAGIDVFVKSPLNK